MHCWLLVAGGDGSRSCRSSEGATPLLDKLGYIELNWDESPGRGHVTAGACRWMIVAERGQRVNLTLYHFGTQPSSSFHSRCEHVIMQPLPPGKPHYALYAVRPSVSLSVILGWQQHHAEIVGPWINLAWLFLPFPFLSSTSIQSLHQSVLIG